MEEHTKRVLWLEDQLEHYQTQERELEYCFVSTMNEMLQIINSPDMLQFDLVVLDINMEQGIEDGKIKEITEAFQKGGLYFPQDEGYNLIEKVMKQGGFFIYLYLLKKGFPSDRICFLTGNSTALDALGVKVHDPEKKSGNKADPNWVLDVFRSMGYVEKLRDEQCNKTALNSAVDKNLEKLLAKSFVVKELRLVKKDIKNMAINNREMPSEEILAGVAPKLESLFNDYRDEKEDEEETRTRDVLGTHIERFHDANLEMIDYFAKEGKIINEGHNWEDFEAWTKKRSADKYIVRWLTMSFCSLMLVELEDQKQLKKLKEEKSDGRGEDASEDNKLIRCMANGIEMDFAEISLNNLLAIFSQVIIPDTSDFYSRALMTVANPFDRSKENSDFEAIVSKTIRNCCAHNYFLKSQGFGAEEFLFCLCLIYLSLRPTTTLHTKVREAWEKRAMKALRDMIGEGEKYKDENFEENLNRSLNRFITEASVRYELHQQAKKDLQRAYKKIKNKASAGVPTDAAEREREIADVIDELNPKDRMEYLNFLLLDKDVPPNYYIFSLLLYFWKSDIPLANGARKYPELHQYAENKLRKIYCSALTLAAKDGK